MKKFSYFLVIVFCLFFISNVKASSINTYLSGLDYSNFSLLNNTFSSFDIGNKNIRFSYLLDTNITNKWLYNSLVLCSDSSFSGGISFDNTYLKDISYNYTNYSCSYSNSNYTGGRVLIVNFKTYLGEESGGSFNGNFTIYQNQLASIQLIDFVVNSNNFVKAENYSTQTTINQNTTIINQNSEIISGQNNIFNQQVETNDKLDDINDFLTDDTEADVDISGLGTVTGLLPEGPVDSLLNIPFTFLSVITSSMGGVCVPVTGTWVFDSTLTIPCFDNFYNQVPDYLMNFINLIPSGFILILYFKHLYKKVERAVSLQTTTDDTWGVI